MHEYQQIQIYNITTGARFETYTLLGEAGTGMIQVNGAAAHLATTGDLIIIASYIQLTPDELATWQPRLVYVNRQNQPSPKPAGKLLPV